MCPFTRHCWLCRPSTSFGDVDIAIAIAMAVETSRHSHQSQSHSQFHSQFQSQLSQRIICTTEEQEAFSRLFGTNSILQLIRVFIFFFCSSQHWKHFCECINNKKEYTVWTCRRCAALLIYIPILYCSYEESILCIQIKYTLCKGINMLRVEADADMHLPPALSRIVGPT